MVPSATHIARIGRGLGRIVAMAARRDKKGKDGCVTAIIFKDG
jgi:hypothetical protein